MPSTLTYRFIEKQLQRIGFRAGYEHKTFAPLRPKAPFWAIGDVHGRCDLMDQILEQVNDDPVIFVGDLIDRGPDSRQVLEKTFDLCCGTAQKFQALMGNHEHMFLEFMNAPESSTGRSWTRYGGLQTLASFGIALTGNKPSDAACRDARDAVMEKVGQPVIEWLSGLPYIWSSGNVHVLHAGANPSCTMAAQEPRDLIWGHSDFDRVRRSDGQWVIHGHTIVPAPTQTNGRVAIDTGAYATGILTAAHVSEGAITFRSTGTV